MSCEKGQHSHIQNKRTSKEAWDALKKVHGIQARGRINLLLKQFHTYKACPDESIDDVASALGNTKVKIGDINQDHKPSDSSLAIALMSAIKDPACNTVNLMLEREPNLTLEVAKEQFKAVQQKLKNEVENEVDNTLPADGKNRKESPPECDHCSKTGHIRVYCWNWLDTTYEGKEWERAYPDQEQKGKSRTKPKSSDQSNSNSSRNVKPTSTNTASSSKSRDKSKSTARVADESEDEESKDAG